MRLATKFGAASAAAALLVCVAGCGGSEKTSDDSTSQAGSGFAAQSAEEIKDQTVADMRKLASLRISGDVNSSDGGAIGIDLALNTEGTCAGTMEVQGGTAQILQVDGSTYLKGDQAFWTASSGDSAGEMMKTLGDKWAKLPAGGGDFGAICDLTQLLDEFDKPPTDGAKEPKIGDVVEFEGQQAVQLISEENGGTSTSWISATGDHYILRIQRVGGEQPGTLTFSDFDEPVDAVAPTAEEFVDMSTMG